MAILTEDMKRVVREQRLGFYATVCEDGSPNLSPKGTTDVWDDHHLFFADIRSPQTVANIRRGSLVEVNVVDPFVRKGYRFKGPAAVHEPGTSLCSDALGPFANRAQRSSTGSGPSCSSRFARPTLSYRPLTTMASRPSRTWFAPTKSALPDSTSGPRAEGCCLVCEGWPREAVLACTACRCRGADRRPAVRRQ